MRNRHKIVPWIYSAPALLLVGMIIVFPIIYTLYVSFTNMNLYHWFDFELIGLANYGRALLKVDSGFVSALLTTIIWTVINIVLQVVIAFLSRWGSMQMG